MTADASADRAVSVDLADHVATVEIHRPPHNWFDIAVHDRRSPTPSSASTTNPTCRAVVLCSEGKNFCAGADLKGSDLLDATDHPLRAGGAPRSPNRKPIVAAVQGAAVGGGLGLVARRRLPRGVTRDPLQLQLRQARVPPGLRHLGHAARGRRPAARARADVHRRSTCAARKRCASASPIGWSPPTSCDRPPHAFASEIASSAPLALLLDPRDDARRPRRPGARRDRRASNQEQQRLRETADFHGGRHRDRRASTPELHGSIAVTASAPTGIDLESFASWATDRAPGHVRRRSPPRSSPAGSRTSPSRRARRRRPRARRAPAAVARRAADRARHGP